MRWEGDVRDCARMLVTLLSECGEATSSQLAGRLSVSSRTVRAYIAESRQALGDSASIIANGDGYHLLIHNEEKFQQILSGSTDMDVAAIPSSYQGRVAYLVRRLTERPGWVTIDQLAAELYVSRHSITNALKGLEAELDAYGLKLERRPRYGIRVSGSDEAWGLFRLSCGGPALAGSVSPDTWGVVGAMMGAVKASFHIDLTDDLEVRVRLARHVELLAKRLRDGAYAENPLLDEIKNRYPLAFAMACRTSDILEERYGTKPPEGELGFLALAFGLGLERKRSGAQKKNVLIVCPAGHTTSYLIERRFRREFGECLAGVSCCDVRSLAHRDISDIDYIFTTVPLAMVFPIPVFQVNYFFDARESHVVRGILTDGDMVRTIEYFDRRLFFPHIAETDRRLVLERLCAEVCSVRGVDQSLLSLVLARESVASTAFGNHVAMPHPLHAVGNDTVIAVGITEAPVVWNERGDMVRAIFLISFGNEDGGLLETLFGRLADFLGDKDAIDRLIEARAWEVLEGALER